MTVRLKNPWEVRHRMQGTIRRSDDMITMLPSEKKLLSTWLWQHGYEREKTTFTSDELDKLLTTACEEKASWVVRFFLTCLRDMSCEVHLADGDD